MKIIVRRLRPGLASWLSHFTFGGVYGSSVIDSHALVDFENAPNGVLICQDLSKCFDSMDLDLLKQALTHYRAPPAFVAVISDFYVDAVRTLAYKGHACDQQLRPTRGMIQGCPASRLLCVLLHEYVGFCATHQGPSIHFH